MGNTIEITEKTPVGQKIIELYNNKGMSAGEIHEHNFDEVPFSVPKIRGCLKIFREKGLLKTKAEIRRIKKLRKLENNPDVQKIIKLVGQGITAKEIYEDKENDIYLGQDRISKIIGECREYGLINPEEEKKAKELRELKVNPIKQTIIKLYNDGIKPYEIYKDKSISVKSSQTIDLCLKQAKEYGLIKSDEEIQIARQKRRNENPTVKRIIELVNDENMTSYSISKYKSDEIPLSRQRIDQIINECEEQGLIVRKKKKTKKIEKEEQEEIPDINEFLNEVKKIYEGQDRIEVVWKYISIGKYKEALDIIRSRYQLKSGIESKEENENLIKLEKLLVKACKVQTAIMMIKEKHKNIKIEDISNSTGLSKEMIAIIKMKLEDKRVKMLTISRREIAISELLKGKNSIYIQNMLNISDLEMIDIENQSKYRQILPEKRDFEAQIKQDSVTRVVVLVTKLGKKPEIIAKALNLKLEVVEECLKNALKVGLIKDNELQGIDLLDYGISNDKERVQ